MEDNYSINSQNGEFSKVSRLARKIFGNNVYSASPLFIDIYNGGEGILDSCVIFRCGLNDKDVLSDSFFEKSKKFLEIYDSSYFIKAKKFKLEYEKNFNQGLCLIKKF
jgi:hypothetical protein